MRALVVGGAGYVGSHVVRGLLADGWEVLVLDNLSTGHAESVPDSVTIYSYDMGLMAGVQDALRQKRADVVIFCAGLTDSGRSMEFPFPYHHNNFVAPFYLLQALQLEKIRKFLWVADFSSYGATTPCPYATSSEKKPQTPLGHADLALENLLQDLATAREMDYIILRVGNVGGALADGRSGPWMGQGNRLLGAAFAVALGEQETFKIFGTDLPTEDGSPVRDLIHVADVADAVVGAAKALQTSTGGAEYLLGTGQPVSVLEIVRAVAEVTHREIPTAPEKAPPTSAAAAYADPYSSATGIHWRATRRLREIVDSEWKWRTTGTERAGK
jgi:UDP-glucose 4-epimerase